MDAEQFYDSLESSEYDSLENSFHEDLENNETDTTLDDDLIPFYDKKLTKSQVDLCRKSSKGSTVINKLSPKKIIKQRKKSTLTKINIKEKRKNKSYLDLLYAQIGVENADSVTSRATCVNLSSRSYETAGSGDDGVSEICKSDDNSESSYASTNQDFSLSLTSLMANLHSISEQNLDKVSSEKRKRSISKIPVRNKLSELGRLGPDISADKLDLYRKRQQYGKKASQTNLIKMIEKKTLQNLEREIKESKICT